MEIANFVFPIRLSRTGAGIFTSTCGITGRAGKFSLAIPTSLYFFLSLTISTQWFSSSLNLISPSGSNRTSSRSFFAGIVPAPSFLTFAPHDVRTLNSKSVAVIVTRPSRASTSRFDRIGIVVLRSTTPCVVVSSFNRADLLTLNSIAWLSSRTVPVADIYTFLREPDPLLRTLLVFRSGRKPYERDYVVGSVEIGGKLLIRKFSGVPEKLAQSTESTAATATSKDSSLRFLFVL